jgi:hypothetical protein
MKRYPEFRTSKRATLDDPNRYPPVAHVWTESALGWANSKDGLGVFGRQPEMREIESLWRNRVQKNL